MNAPSLNEIRGAMNREPADEKMDQVREILVGDSFRRMEARVGLLEQRLKIWRSASAVSSTRSKPGLRLWQAQPTANGV